MQANTTLVKGNINWIEKIYQALKIWDIQKPQKRNTYYCWFLILVQTADLNIEGMDIRNLTVHPGQHKIQNTTEWDNVKNKMGDLFSNKLEMVSVETDVERVNRTSEYTKPISPKRQNILV